MGKVEAVFGGPLARGSPGYGALKRGGGEGGGMKISRGGVEWACLWYIPMFRFPGVVRLQLHVLVPWSCKVATLGVMLSAMVVVLAGELSLAMASSVWGFARVRFSRIK